MQIWGENRQRHLEGSRLTELGQGRGEEQEEKREEKGELREKKEAKRKTGGQETVVQNG